MKLSTGLQEAEIKMLGGSAGMSVGHLHEKATSGAGVYKEVSTREQVRRAVQSGE